MFVYLVFTAIALLLTSKAIAGLFRERFPHPNDFATLSIAYYGIPLSMCGYFDWSFDHMAFLAPFAADRGLAMMSMRFICLAMLALAFGRYLGKQFGPATFSRYSELSVFAGERVRFALLGLIALIGLGVYLFGFREFLSGYATESSDLTGVTGNAVVYSTLELMGLASAYGLVLGLAGGRTPAKFLMLACLVIALLVLGVRAKRLEVVSAFIPVFLVFISKFGSVRAFSWRLGVAAVAILVLVIVSIARVSSDFTVQQAIFMVFAEGLYAGHSMPGIIERLMTYTLSYEYGGRYISALFGFVPRFMWEGKDDLVYAGNIALEGVAPLGATSVLAEVVLQGGLVAVAVSFTIMGFVFERIWRFTEIWDSSLARKLVPARFGAYLIVMAIFIPHFRDGIIPTLKLALQASVFYFLLSGMRLLPVSSKIAAPAPDNAPSEAPSRRPPSLIDAG
jgi:hypothetical protein